MTDKQDRSENLAPEETPAPEQQAVPQPPATLTTPCTLNALRAWLKAVDVATPGYEKLANVTSTATTISVA